METKEGYRSDYDFFKSKGICPICKKEKSATNRVMCYECLEKKKIYNKKQRSDPVVRSHINEINIRNYYRRKSLGVCVKCNKKATNGLYCYEHYIYKARKNKELAAKRKLERMEAREKANEENYKRRAGAT